MNMHEQLENCRLWADLALDQLGLRAGLLPCSWNGRLTSTMGRHLGRQTPAGERSGRLEFSPKLFERATQDQRDETAAHEAAHGVVWLLHGRITRGRGQRDIHGPVWQRTMRALGFEPNRCHNVSTAGLGRKSQILSCGLCGGDLGACGPKKAAKLRAALLVSLPCCGRRHGSTIIVTDTRRGS